MLLNHIFFIVGAAVSAVAASSTYTQEVCLTKYGSKSTKSIKTVSLLPTITVPIIRKTTSTPSVTTTAKAPTSTITSFVTTTSTSTLPQVIVTFDTTTTYYETTTSTVVVSSTETDTASPVTITSTPATSTIGTSAGFTPIQSAQPGAAKMRRRDENQALRRRVAAASLPKGLTISGTAKAPYPTEVDCAGLVEVFSTRTSVITAKTTLTVTSTSPVITVSTTSTITTITSLLPTTASTTLLFSTTSTISTTTTSSYSTTTTVTPTVTEVASTPTTYAMCQANNFASLYDGFSIDYVGFSSGLLSQASTNTAYDCCVLCATTPGCGGAASVPGICFLSDPAGGCDGSMTAAVFETSTTDTNPADGFTVSNGQCGQYVYQPS
jgi:hypothetical protein